MANIRDSARLKSLLDGLENLASFQHSPKARFSSFKPRCNEPEGEMILASWVSIKHFLKYKY
jgi:hypothetical protein